MAADDLGPWAPMSVADAIALFRTAPFRWWLSGGHALETHVGHSWRDHADLDIGILRSDVVRLPEVLDGWYIRVGAGGVLTPWDGGPLDADRSQNNLWCRPTANGPWMLDLTIGDGNDREWIYRRDPSIRRPWHDAVLTARTGAPYLAPELQLLFKSKDVRPKDDLDAATVIPLLEPERRSWLAHQLPADHDWQTAIARTRARGAIAGSTGVGIEVDLHASGRTSQAWKVRHRDGQWIVRVPIPNSGRLISYRSEVLISSLLADAGHPVSTWRLEQIDDVECSIGPFLDGSAIDASRTWPRPFVDAIARVLRDLHRLPATGWGPLENRTDRLHGMSPSAVEGIVERWFHAAIWPFDASTLDAHPLATLDPQLVEIIADLERSILDAAAEPFGVVHSDLHREHLLREGDELSGILDFGDAFVGSTAWDFALLRWYYGAANTNVVADAYGADLELRRRADLLAVAVGCYKIAKSPGDEALSSRLRLLLDALADGTS